eukprot:1142050-Pelagomonas_calceolata.AAC.6
MLGAAELRGGHASLHALVQSYVRTAAAAAHPPSLCRLEGKNLSWCCVWTRRRATSTCQRGGWTI